MPTIENVNVIIVEGETEYSTVHEQLKNAGYIRSDEPFCIDYTMIGYVYAKLDRWHIAYDFQIVSIIEE